MGEKEKLKVFIILLKSDLFDLDSKIIGNFRRKVTKGIVGDDDLGKVSFENNWTSKKYVETIESHVEHLLDVKVAHFVRSKHYKGRFIQFIRICF